MATYTMTCDIDHEPMTFKVEAADDDDAMQKMMEELKSHAMDHHSDLADKSDDELMEMIKSKWHKSEESGSDSSDEMSHDKEDKSDEM